MLKAFLFKKECGGRRERNEGTYLPFAVPFLRFSRSRTDCICWRKRKPKDTGKEKSVSVIKTEVGKKIPLQPFILRQLNVKSHFAVQGNLIPWELPLRLLHLHLSSIRLLYTLLGGTPQISLPGVRHSRAPHFSPARKTFCWGSNGGDSSLLALQGRSWALVASSTHWRAGNLGQATVMQWKTQQSSKVPGCSKQGFPQMQQAEKIKEKKLLIFKRPQAHRDLIQNSLTSTANP